MGPGTRLVCMHAAILHSKRMGCGEGGKLSPIIVGTCKLIHGTVRIESSINIGTNATLGPKSPNAYPILIRRKLYN